MTKAVLSENVAPYQKGQVVTIKEWRGPRHLVVAPHHKPAENLMVTVDQLIELTMDPEECLTVKDETMSLETYLDRHLKRIEDEAVKKFRDLDAEGIRNMEVDVEGGLYDSYHSPVHYKLVKCNMKKAVNAICNPKPYASWRLDNVITEKKDIAILKEAKVLDAWFEPIKSDPLPEIAAHKGEIGDECIKYGCKTFSYRTIQELNDQNVLAIKVGPHMVKRKQLEKVYQIVQEYYDAKGAE